VINAFEREGVETWTDVLDLSSADLLDLRNLGERSVQQFLAYAIQVSAQALERVHVSSPHLPPLSLPPAQVSSDRLSSLVLQFRQLIRWAHYECDARSFGELLSALPQSSLPPGVADLWQDLSGRDLESLIGEGDPHVDMPRLLEDLLGLLDERDRFVLSQRISSNEPHTLNDLAEDLGLTRERVRQLEVRAGEKIAQAINDERFAPVRWRAHRLRSLLGSASPPAGDHFHQTTTHITRDFPEATRQGALDLYLWLAGPYERDPGTGWLTVGSVPGPETISEFCDTQGRVNVAGLTERLVLLGIVSAVQPIWMHEVAHLRFIEGHYYRWSGTVADKAAILLQLWGRPATAEEIVDGIGEGHNVRSTRSRLFEDSRFTRVDMDHVALRAWGLPEYSGIAAEIGEDIDRRGGSANVEEVITTLVRQFSLREQSVRAYLAAPMFIIEGDKVRRRTDSDAFGVPPRVTTTPACYVLGSEAITWRVEVNAELLRGSGRPMPAALAAWLGVSPGGRLLFTCNESTVTVSWPATSASGPSIGSVRPALEKASCASGDQVLLHFHREERTLLIRRLDPVAIGSEVSLRRVSLLTGIPLEGEGRTFLQALGRAVGTAGAAASIRAMLRSRGEADLADLIPDEEMSGDLDAAIKSLGELL
jgi:hypothetical protein